MNRTGKLFGMSDPSSDVGKLESAALARKERLAKLKAAKQNQSSASEVNKGNVNSELPR